jgi:hypothetical protein
LTFPVHARSGSGVIEIEINTDCDKKLDYTSTQGDIFKSLFKPGWKYYDQQSSDQGQKDQYGEYIIHFDLPKLLFLQRSTIMDLK